MGAGILIVAVLALLLIAGVYVMSAALDRLTASVTAATTALSDATAAAGNTGPTDDAALNALADSLDSAVASYRNATSTGSGNPLDPAA